MRMNVSKVSVWVDPGAGSAVLKFGFTSTTFPETSGIPNASTTLVIPAFRSGPKATHTLDLIRSP
jgi:hypothetical protein